MKFLFASDSFKGSLTSERITEILTETARKNFPGCETVGFPVADGGEGTAAAVTAAVNGTMESVVVHGPLGEKITAVYGKISEKSAIIEMAAASGLPLILPDKRNPLKTTSVGTGEMLCDALDKGFRDISIAIGGSATNDGGMGAMTALGIRFLDENGNKLEGTGEDLEKVASIDMSGLHPAVSQTVFTVMCDVNNPLTGENGAVYTFAEQKGADEEKKKQLEAGMQNYAKVIRKQFGIDANAIPGAGAAGGLGAALKVFLKADLKSGIETVLDLISFDSALEGTDLVITGEGCMDWQSAFGKVPGGVGLRCKSRGIPVIAIVGGMGKNARKMYEYGISSIISTVNAPMSVEEAMQRAEELYTDAADRVFRMLKI
ncbi:MAG: glycerate kinase [Lachnospiraceae bacterium]|nr:glycerate kinase [Lachnospiraceae bacterium]